MDLAESGAAAAKVADAIICGVRQHADPSYVAGTVIARRPAKPVLGVRIPLLRSAVRTAVRADVRSGADRADVYRCAADLLWQGCAHEYELAACMLLRLTTVSPTAELATRWAALLDNWLSVDELGGLVGDAIVSKDLHVEDLRGLAAGPQWQRRLYLVSLIAPIRDQGPGVVRM